MKQLRALNLNDLVFIDTETARTQKVLIEGTPDFEAWEYKVKRLAESEGIDINEHYVERSGLYSEFSRLVCISVGRIKGGKLVITSYRDSDEKELLARFMGDLEKVIKHKPKTCLVGHSVIGFDIPFIFRRSLANEVIPARLVDVGGLKPWEVTAIDTKILWKGSGYYPASLISVCLALNIPSPKSDITGAEVGNVYHNEGEEGLKRIVKYCERDVMAVVNVVLRCRCVGEEIYTEYETQEPKERKEEGLMDRIAKSGMVTGEDRAEIFKKAKGADIDEKEKIIKLLKAALIISKRELSQGLELEILGV